MGYFSVLSFKIYMETFGILEDNLSLSFFFSFHVPIVYNTDPR